MLKKLLNQIHLIYFSGDIELSCSLEKTLPWPEVQERFRGMSKGGKEAHQNRLIAVSDESVVVYELGPSGYRPPANNQTRQATITPSESHYEVTVHLSQGSFSHLFMPLWKGTVFIITTLLFLGVSWAALMGAVNLSLPGYFILIIVTASLHMICWVLTHVQIAQGKSLVRFVESAIS
jgi:hypothetical protein